MSVRRHSLARFLTAIASLVALTISAHGVTRRVDSQSRVNGPGLAADWLDAYRVLQDAIDASSAGDVILVAHGTYFPDEGASHVADDPAESFAISARLNGIKLRGDFAGIGASNPDAQDLTFTIHPTILSGAIGGESNSFHVISVTAVDSTTLIEGFIITQGQAFCGSPGCPTYGDRGGGINNFDGGSPTIANCLFVDNKAIEGAGIANINESCPIIRQCRFINNNALGNAGGGVHNRFITNSPGPCIVNCEFFSNIAWNTGGGMSFQHANGIAMNCIFVGNSCGHQFPDGSIQGGGGAIRIGPDNAVRLINCDFVANHSFQPGGGVAIGHIHDLGKPTRMSFVHNCIFWNNTQEGGSPIGAQFALLGVYASHVSVSYNNMQGGLAQVVIEGGELEWGDGNINVDPLFVRIPNPAAQDQGDLALRADSPCINRGNCDELPDDLGDLDGDHITAEVTPLDLALHFRRVGRVDLGAYESFTAPCRGDITRNGSVDIDDLVSVITQWSQSGAPTGDIAPFPCPDHVVNINDLVEVITHWGACPLMMNHLR